MVCQTIISERCSKSVRIVRIERSIPSVWPACDFFSRSEERADAAACLKDD